MRFPNDARFIATGGSDYRGAVLKIVATDAPVSHHAGHASEVSIDDVRSEDMAATIVSSRAQGVEHLTAQVDEALRGAAGFAALRPTWVGRL